MNLEVSPDLTIAAAELCWRFSRSSGPGGQHVNTSDSRVELAWNISHSSSLTETQRERLLGRLDHQLNAGVLTVTASEQRSQLRNRETAVVKLTALVSAALQPDPIKRRSTKPTKGSKRRHLATKTQRSETKRLRQRPAQD